jgi:hypothetical protein
VAAAYLLDRDPQPAGSLAPGPQGMDWREDPPGVWTTHHNGGGGLVYADESADSTIVRYRVCLANGEEFSDSVRVGRGQSVARALRGYRQQVEHLLERAGVKR